MSDPIDGTTVQRRSLLVATGTAIVTALAGCSSGGDGNTNDDDNSGDGNGNSDGGATIAAGPDGSLTFEPKEVTISTGETVTWEFESPAHNVSAWPDMHDEISIPDGAPGFGTMEEGGDELSMVSKGETLEHTFDTVGEYTYVCVPHAASDMVGTVIVE
jgi:plastocyanin